MKTKTVNEFLDFATNELRAANIRGAHIDQASSSVYLNVRRAFAIEGTLDVSLDVVASGKAKDPVTFVARVSVNFPACNKSALEAAAFMHLVNELTPLCVMLQVQLNQFQIVVNPKE